MTRSTALGGVVRGSAAILVASCIQYTEIPQAPELPAVSAPPSASTLTHRVEPGETVWRIARRHGLPVEVIIETNHIEDVRKLRVGQLVTIPAAPGRSSERARSFREPADRRTVFPSGSTAVVGEALPLEEEQLRVAKIDAVLALGEGHLRLAEVDQALEMANQALRLLEEAPEAPGARTRFARAEVIIATVHIAYAREDAALESLRRARRADPHLELDPGTTSPKLLRIFEAAGSEID